MRYFIIIIITVCFTYIPVNSFSSELFTKIAPEVRYINGVSTYHISFDNSWAYGGHCESELEWPIDNWFAGINLAVGTKGDSKNLNQTKGQFNLSLLGRISEDSGVIKDSDWIENDGYYGYPLHSGKDLYGECDADLEEGIIFDVSYAYNFSLNKNFSIGPIIGFRYTNLRWSAWNLVQRNYGPYVADNHTDTNGWEWLRYEVSYRIPYVGVNSEILFGKNNQFRLNLNFSYSNWVDVNDKDTHLYPDWDAANPGYDYDMISEGDSEGEAYIAKIECCWGFRPNWSLDLGGEYVDIDTEGSIRQTHYINGIFWYSSTGTIKDTRTSSYWSAILRITYYTF